MAAARSCGNALPEWLLCCVYAQLVVCRVGV